MFRVFPRIILFALLQLCQEEDAETAMVDARFMGKSLNYNFIPALQSIGNPLKGPVRNNIGANRVSTLPVGDHELRVALVLESVDRRT